MARRRKDPPGPAGFLVVDKPVGMTSHDVVDQARRWLGVRRIGHLGTLDPLATGVLPLAVREATKLGPYIVDERKHYVGTVCLGVATDTYDAEGAPGPAFEGTLPEAAQVEAALAGFLGEIQQVPPMYSSVKKDGEPLYKRARRGEEVEREARPVTIHGLEMLHYQLQPADDGPARAEVGIAVRCSPGTYVRTLAHDLGCVLGCGAHLSGLRRTRSGPFHIEQARTPEELAALAEAGKIEEALLAPDEAVGLPRVSLSAAQARRVGNGGDIPAAEARGEFERGGRPPRPGDRLCALAPTGTLLAILELRPDRRLYPLRVLAL